MERSLDEVLRAATSCAVVDVIPKGDRAGLVLRGPEVLSQLRSLLQVQGDGGFVCACLGDTLLRFSADAGPVATVVVHHAASLRWDGWDSHRELVNGQELAQWLAAHGSSTLLDRLRQSEGQQQELAELTADWSTATPAEVAHLLPGMLATTSTGSVPASLVDDLRQTVTEAWPVEADRAGVLLAWFGAGTGRSSGYPVHEGLPGTLLAELPIESLVQALERDPVRDQVWRGAVRHLAMRRVRPAPDHHAVPAAVRQRLLRIATDQDPAQARALEAAWRSADRNAEQRGTASRDQRRSGP